MKLQHIFGFVMNFQAQFSDDVRSLARADPLQPLQQHSLGGVEHPNRWMVERLAYK